MQGIQAFVQESVHSYGGGCYAKQSSQTEQGSEQCAQNHGRKWNKDEVLCTFIKARMPLTEAKATPPEINPK